MDFQTINALSQKELLLLLFGFFLGVSTRIGGYVFTLAIAPIKAYIKLRKKRAKKMRKKAKKQAFKEWQLNNLQKLDTKDLEKLAFRLDKLDKSTDDNPPNDKSNT